LNIYNIKGDTMVYKQTIHILTPLLLIFALFLSGCAQAIQPVTTNENVPTPVTTDSADAVDNPDIFADPEFFLPPLLQALTAHETEKLQQWMTNPFLESTWRFNQSEISPDEAIYFLYADQLGTENKLELVKDADLKTLLGDVDPLSIPGSESGVMYAYLVSGWGKDGRDEAILFITREPADNLKWHGWMQVKGGFSGARIGGIQAYTDDALGFSVFLPKDYEVSNQSDSEVMFLAPGEGHPSDDRAAAIINVEPANGRTAEQVATAIAEDNKSVMGAGYTGANITVMEIDGEAAYSVDRLTGQDFNRRLYMVHDDQLYWMMFVPDNPQAAAYPQMEDVYAMIVNTFRFTR
jgi:hypothetical protein